MNLPSRGERESATTTRYVGAFVLPVRRRRMCTANVGRPPVKAARGIPSISAAPVAPLREPFRRDEIEHQRRPREIVRALAGAGQRVEELPDAGLRDERNRALRELARDIAK